MSISLISSERGGIRLYNLGENGIRPFSPRKTWQNLTRKEDDKIWWIELVRADFWTSGIPTFFVKINKHRLMKIFFCFMGIKFQLLTWFQAHNHYVIINEPRLCWPDLFFTMTLPCLEWAQRSRPKK